MIDSIVSEEFNKEVRDYIERIPIDSEFTGASRGEALKFCLEHERKHLCIQNLKREFKDHNFDKFLMDLHHHEKAKKNIIDLTKDFARAFVVACVRAKNEEIKSIHQKIKEERMRQEADRLLEEEMGGHMMDNDTDRESERV